MRIPLIDCAGHGVDSPANEDSKLGVLEPLRNLMVLKGLPVRTVRAIVGLAVGFIEECITTRIVLRDRELPLAIDLFGGLDAVCGSQWVGELSSRDGHGSGGFSLLGRNESGRCNEDGQD